MKKFILIFSTVLIYNVNFAQQDPQLTHYMFNNVAFNPGYAGMNGEICMNLLSHQQWLKFEGAPQTTLLTIDSPIKLFNRKWGVGLKLYDDRYGFVKNFTTAVNIAYHQDIGLGKLGIGIDAGIFNKEFESPAWDFPEQSETILPAGSRKLIYDMHIGAFYRIENFQIGLSSSHLLRPKLIFEAETGDASEIFLSNHFFLAVKDTFYSITRKGTYHQ